MSTPIVSENIRRLESVTHDSFIDDLATTRGAEQRAEPFVAAGRPALALGAPRI
jgi:hypothetical protein